MATELKITKKVPLENNILICSFPGMWQVGTAASAYILSKRDIEEVGYIHSNYILPQFFVHQGRVVYPIRIFKDRKGDFVFIHSETIIPPEIIYDVMDLIVEFAKKNKIRMIVALGGMQAVSEERKMWALVSTDEAEEYTKAKGIDILQEGIIMGATGVLMAKCRVEEVMAVNLLVEAMAEKLRRPDLVAVEKLVKTLDDFIGLKVDLRDLQKEIKNIEKMIREKAEKMKKAKETMKKLEEYTPMYR